MDGIPLNRPLKSNDDVRPRLACRSIALPPGFPQRWPSGLGDEGGAALRGEGAAPSPRRLQAVSRLLSRFQRLHGFFTSSPPFLRCKHSDSAKRRLVQPVTENPV